METREEGVFTVYDNGILVSIVKRDEASKKWITYKTEEAGGEEIVALIKNNNQE